VNGSESEFVGQQNSKDFGLTTSNMADPINPSKIRFSEHEFATPRACHRCSGPWACTLFLGRRLHEYSADRNTPCQRISIQMSIINVSLWSRN